jgi:hypothetical protein
MATSLSGTVKTTPTLTYINTLDAQRVSATIDADVTRTATYSNGTGANQAQHVWIDERSLLTTTDETLDLTSLANGAFGTLTFSKIKELIIQVTTATPGYRLLVGGAATNAVSGCLGDPSDIIRVDAGGQVHISSPVDGFAIDGTHKSLKIENPSGGTVAYRIMLVGLGSNA